MEAVQAFCSRVIAILVIVLIVNWLVGSSMSNHSIASEAASRLHGRIAGLCVSGILLCVLVYWLAGLAEGGYQAMSAFVTNSILPMWPVGTLVRDAIFSGNPIDASVVTQSALQLVAAGCVRAFLPPLDGGNEAKSKILATLGNIVLTIVVCLLTAWLFKYANFSTVLTNLNAPAAGILGPVLDVIETGLLGYAAAYFGQSRVSSITNPTGSGSSSSIFTKPLETFLTKAGLCAAACVVLLVGIACIPVNPIVGIVGIIISVGVHEVILASVATVQ